MSHRQTKFLHLPNEVICCIFDFLTSWDIIRAFAHLNIRYDELVRFYIKEIDLSDDGQEKDPQQLQWISKTVQKLRVSEFHCAVLNEYRFPQLHSLYLLNIDQWFEIISRMNLKSLKLFSEDNSGYYTNPKLIPQTLSRFSTNELFHPDNFHTNLIHLDVVIQSMTHLTNIVEHTPNVAHLSVTFANDYSKPSSNTTYQFDCNETRIINFHLTKLTFLSIRTKQIKGDQHNLHLPFDEIDIFINQRCPNVTILKRIVLQLHRISFCKNRWSTIVRYKTTFSRFDFYGSFIVDETKILLNTDRFDFHIEDLDTSNSMGLCVHVYSLPFTFDKLYGFNSCSDLSSHTSFSTVRYLYVAQTPSDDRPVSFKSLSKRMPYLLSIDYRRRCFLNVDDGMIVPEVTHLEEVFTQLCSFRFDSSCWNKHCICLHLLLQLIDRMPQLRNLTTSHHHFLPGTKSASTIERLDLRGSHLNNFDLLPQYVPYLKILFLDCSLIYPNDISRVIGHLFLNIPSLRLIYSPLIYTCGLNRTPYGKYRQEALTLIQNMDNRLRRLKLGSQYGGNTYYLSNSD